MIVRYTDLAEQEAQMHEEKPFLKRWRWYFELSAQRGKEGHLSLFRQLSEMAVLTMFYGVRPGYYHASGFWRRSIPWKDKRGHITGRRFGKLVDSLNHPRYHKLSQHKVVEKALLQLLNIPTPRYLGYLNAGSGRCADGSPLTGADDLMRLVNNTDESRICFKLVEGFGGLGFDAVEVIREGGEPQFRLLRDGSIMTIGEYYDSRDDIARGGSVMLETYMEQHPRLAEFNPSSVNTLRLWALERDSGDVEIVLAYFRMGRQGMLVDNITSGGIGAPIDLETGILRKAIDALPGRCEFPVHPDHGAQIDGVKLYAFEEAKSLARSCLKAFPRMKFAGIDVAISTNGPVILEMNVTPDGASAGIVDIPHRKIFFP